MSKRSSPGGNSSASAEPAADAATSSSESGAERRVCQFVKYAWQEADLVHRRQLKAATYNPRRIGDGAKRKLKKNLAERGLINRIIWNRRTGNVVGGHQRLVCLDELEKTRDYWLPVDIVDLDEQQERAANVFLNNGSAGGEFDLAKLQDMFSGDAAIAAEAAGFEAAEMYQLFGDGGLQQDLGALAEFAERTAKARELKHKIKESLQVRNETEFYLVVFASEAERNRFLDRLGLPENRYVNGRELSSRLLGEGEEAAGAAESADEAD